MQARLSQGNFFGRETIKFFSMISSHSIPLPPIIVQRQNASAIRKNWNNLPSNYFPIFNFKVLKVHSYKNHRILIICLLISLIRLHFLYITLCIWHRSESSNSIMIFFIDLVMAFFTYASLIDSLQNGK